MFADAYPVRQPVEPIQAMNFEHKLCRAISQALKECPKSRAIVAAEMGEYLGEPQISKNTLDGYSSESRETHRITVARFLALVHVTDAVWLLDLAAEQVGCTVVQGAEARFTEMGLIDQQIKELTDRKAAIAAQAPVKVRRRRTPK